MTMGVEERLERIERLMVIGAKNVLTTSELALVLGVSASRIRHMVSEREIPHYRQGNKVFFRKSEIEDWQLAQRIPTNAEINSKATTHIVTSNKYNKKAFNV
jgi:hypothetical protein|nr:MAG TPA: helix-turn-helix domain protein [Caudoviricetes sp.]